MIFARFSTVRDLTLITMLLPIPAAAQVAITEIMYDLSEGSDSGREWLEVYVSESVDLTKLKLVENGSSHVIKAVSGGALVRPGAYVVIADNPTKFRADHPAYTGVLFDSAFSLNNDGEELSIATGDVAIDSVVYTSASANGTGDSLQRNPGSAQFDAGIPTPGVGIPGTGLLKSVPMQKGKKKQTAAASVAVQTEVVGKSDFPSEPPALTPIQIPIEGTVALWWLAPFLLGGFAAAGTSLSRHYKKSEWDIIEER